MAEKERLFTVNISKKNWKILHQYKITKSLASMDIVVTKILDQAKVK